MDQGPNPSASEEIDDQFRALMEGLRTTIPGVMVMFSFLLVLPFQGEFVELATLDRVVYYVAFASAAVASVLLIAPSAHQRVRAPISGIKRTTMSHVMTATRLAIIGTGFFMVSIVAVVFMVSSLIVGSLLASISGALAAVLIVWAWLYIPLVRFKRDQ